MAERRNLTTLRRLHARSLTRFQRAHKRIAGRLPDSAKESSEEAQKQSVKDAYQLLRSFCYSYNFAKNSDREAPRFEMPKDFEADLKKALTAANYAKYDAAIKATKEEYEAQLPAKITVDSAEKLLKFVQDREADHITSKYETKMAELTEKINAIKVEKPREPRVKKERTRRNSDNSDDKPAKKAKKAKKEEPLEDQLHSVLTQVAKRSDSVRFSKDDFESFSEAQSQLDALFKETVTEIMKMKQRLRTRFNRMQNRKPRNKKKD